MKPIGILNVLQLAYHARKNDDVFNPLFTGDAGLGKSQICQKFVHIMRTTGFPETGIKPNPNFGFLDLRIAYYEAPDMIGFPETIEDKNGKKRTSHCLPDFWPTEGEGLILIEEPNRGTTGVMNTLMQMLTDREINGYKIPPGWMFAACINPDSAEYDVNAMDAALKNRFEDYEVEYDAISFLDYIENSKWHDSVQMFIKSGVWVYKDTKSVGDGGKYISPRTWSKVNAAEKALDRFGRDRRLHRETMYSLLGKDIGNEYHKFCFEEAPVTAKDLISDKKKALKRLEKQSDPSSYKGDMVAVTVESISQNYSCSLEDDDKKGLVGEKTMVEVAEIIPSDQAINLIKACGFKQSGGKISAFFQDFIKRNPQLAKVLKSNIRLDRTNKDS